MAGSILRCCEEEKDRVSRFDCGGAVSVRRHGSRVGKTCDGRRVGGDVLVTEERKGRRTRAIAAIVVILNGWNQQGGLTWIDVVEAFVA